MILYLIYYFQYHKAWCAAMNLQFNVAFEDCPDPLLCMWHVLKNLKGQSMYKNLPKNLQTHLETSIRAIIQAEDSGKVQYVS